MFSSIKTSSQNRARVTELTNQLQLGTENIIARIALTYSLSKGEQLDLSSIQDSKGKEYSKKVLFGDNFPFYVALICQHYGIYKSNSEIPKYLKLHIDNGITLLYEEFSTTSNSIEIDLLINLLSNSAN